jgi:hypothetical protein
VPADLEGDMSRKSRIRWLAIPAAGAAAALLAMPAASAPKAAPYLGEPSDQFWAAHQENDARQPIVNGIYEPNTDDLMQGYIAKANALSRYTTKKWRNAGPFGGIQDVQGVGSGAEQFGPVGGIGTAIAVDPDPSTHGNTVYFGTHGGLWKSTDGGLHLKNLSDNVFERDSIGAIGIDPNNDQNVYVGTGVSLLTLSDDAAGVGTYVSHDGGKTFVRPKLNTHGYGTNAIAVLPDARGTVLVGTNYGLWSSTDHGHSFHQITLKTNSTHTAAATHPLGNWVTAIAVKPTDPNEVTVAVGYARGTAKLPDNSVIGTGNGLYRSNDGGKTFAFQAASTSGLTWPGASSDPVGRVSLAYGQVTGQENVLWALVSDAGRAAGQTLGDLPSLPVSPTGNSVLNGLYESTDDGGNWTVKATAQSLATALGATTASGTYLLGYAAGVQAFYNNWVLTDPVNPNRVYIGLEEAYQGDFLPNTGSTPFAVQWTGIEKYANLCGFLTYFNTVPGSSQGVSCPQVAPFFGGGSTHPDQHGFAITKTTGTGVRLYSGNDGGWWSQNAHTVTGQLEPAFENTDWTSLNTQTATVLPWDLNFLQDGSIVAGLQDNGAIRIRKNGTAYNVCGGDGIYVFPGANSQSYYCGIDGQLILATRDDFHDTINVTPTNNATGVSFLSPYAVDLTDPNHLIAAAGNVDMTTAGPDTNTYDPTFTELLSSKWVTVFTPPPVSDPAVKADSINWDSSAVSTTGPVSYVAMCAQCRPSLSVGPAITDPSHVHTLVATNVRAGCKPTKATSACWHAAKGIGLPHQMISGFAVDPNDARTIYASLRQYLLLGADPKVTGTQKVMVSHDAGDHWTDLTGNLPRSDAHAIDIRDGRLVVATDVGIFTTTAGSTKWAKLGEGLPAVPFRSMNLDRTGRYVLAGAFGRGPWIYDFGSAAQTPPTTIPPVPGLQHLSATGLDPMWPILGVVLVGLGAYVARRRRHT